MNIARRVAGQLGIPFYAVNAQNSYLQNLVVQYFLAGMHRRYATNSVLGLQSQYTLGILARTRPRSRRGFIGYRAIT